MALVTNPIQYRHGKGGGTAHGIEASALPMICDVWHLLSENKKAESELAALKARIAGSVELRVGDPAWSDGTLADMEGKRVRLVVEE